MDPNEIKAWCESPTGKLYKESLEEKLSAIESEYRRATKDDFEKLQGILDGLTYSMVLFDEMATIVRERMSKEE